MTTATTIREEQTQFTNRILHGDCIDVMRQMPAASVDFILTDPPYLVNYTATALAARYGTIPTPTGSSLRWQQRIAC